jgi:alginate O-acetyltransferase complex protein AlgI
MEEKNLLQRDKETKGQRTLKNLCSFVPLFLCNNFPSWLLFLISVLAIYWLQAPLTPRFADFLLPTTTLNLTILSWWLTRQPDSAEQQATWREDRFTLLLLFGLMVGLAFNRYLPATYRLTASRPPEPTAVALGLLIVGAIGWLLFRLAARKDANRALTGGIWLIIILFVLLKSEPLATAVAAQWRTLTGQNPTLAVPADLAWLGFSYVAFRLIHTLRDRQSGILPVLSLREYVTYVIFAPAFIAGPIDRAERFVADLRALPSLAWLDAPRIAEAGGRIARGLFMKFVIADTLALGMSLTAVNAAQAASPLALWGLLYGYALRLYFDFAGYTDIAIGIGLLVGIRLPENFKRPYLKNNITAFWQSWHITLSDWARFYVFTPLSRKLLRRKPRPAPALILFTAHLSTMIVIGLWHGITWSFLIWGLWHGLGLFIHKQWSDRTRKWYRSLEERPGQKRAWTLFGWFVTFNFVVLGWVWFALPDLGLAAGTFMKLFGIGW